VIPECLLDHDETIEVESASWAGSDLLLSLKCVSDAARWVVTCKGVSGWCIRDRIAEGVRVTEDDPVLWRSQFATYTVYFAGKPNDPYRAACDLLSAIPKTAGVLDMLPNRLADLLATGAGSIGSLPIPAIRVCDPILKRHGVEIYHLGTDESDTTVVSTALWFGNASFVIAEQFHAERQE
jgi:hypothetical protein